MLLCMLYYLGKLFWVLFTQFLPQCIKELRARYIFRRVSNPVNEWDNKLKKYVLMPLWKGWLLYQYNWHMKGSHILKSNKYYFGY